MFPKFVSCCLDAKIYKCMINCLYPYFFFFFLTFGQCQVLVKQITTSFFKSYKKLWFLIQFKGDLRRGEKGIQNLNTEQKRAKIRHGNVENRKTTSIFTKISINRPPLFWLSCKSGKSYFKGNIIFSPS